MIPKLLNLVGIPRVYVKAMEAMGKDSQEFTPISRKGMGKHRAAYVTKFEVQSSWIRYDASGVPGLNFGVPGLNWT